MTPRITLPALACLLFGTMQASAIELSVNDAVELALKNNTTLINSAKTVQIFEQKVKQYWASIYPSIAVGAAYNRNLEIPAFFIGGTSVKTGENNAFSAQATLSQVLWSGGKVNAAIRLAQYMSKQTDEEDRLNRINVVRDVKQVYYKVLLASATAIIERDNLALAQDHLQQMKAQYQQGLQSDLTLLRQDVEVSKREPSVIKARNVSEVGLLSLKTLMGQDPEYPVTLNGDFDGSMAQPKPLEELYSTAMARRPDLRAARYYYDSAKQQYRLAKADFLPSIYANASRSFSGQSAEGWPSPDMRNWSSSVGVTLNLNLFAGGATVAQMKQAELQASQASTSIEELERDIRVQVKSAWLDLQEAQERIRSQEGAVNQASQAARSTLTRFKNGLSSQLELNDAENALNDSRLQYALAQHDACVAHAQLEWATGAID